MRRQRERKQAEREECEEGSEDGEAGVRGLEEAAEEEEVLPGSRTSGLLSASLTSNRGKYYQEFHRV